MYAVEFETQISNGIVHIPQQFEQLYEHRKAKVIIMVDDAGEVQLIDLIKKLSNSPIHVEETTTFLSREQANER